MGFGVWEIISGISLGTITSMLNMCSLNVWLDCFLYICGLLKEDQFRGIVGVLNNIAKLLLVGLRPGTSAFMIAKASLNC